MANWLIDNRVSKGGINKGETRISHYTRANGTSFAFQKRKKRKTAAACGRASGRRRRFSNRKSEPETAALIHVPYYQEKQKEAKKISKKNRIRGNL